MAGDNEKLDFEINLDAKEMIEGLQRINESLEKMGEPSKLDGLAHGLGELSKVVGVLGGSFLAFKASLDTIFEAEKIKQVNVQFESLASNAGLAATKLKEDLIGATKGMVDDTEVLKAANKALVEMGDSAGRLPEVMELARKSAVIMGGDTVQRFEEITQAISTGNERALKHLGLQVDVNAAYEKMAKSLGVTAGQLTEAAKHQALLNEVLEVGKNKFKDVDENITKNINSWNQLKAVVKEIGEIFSLVFEKVLGPVMNRFLTMTKTGADQVKDFLVDKFGEGAEQAQAHAKRIHGSIDELEGKLKELDKTGQTFFNGAYIKKGTAEADAAVKQINTDLAALKTQYKEATAHVEEFEKKEQETAAKRASMRGGDQLVDQNKVRADQAKFQNSLLQLHEQRLNSEIAATSSWAEQEKLALEKIEIENEKHQQRLLQISANKELNDKQKRELSLAEEEAHQAKLEELESRNFDLKMRNIEAQKQATMDGAQFDELVEQQKTMIRENHAAQLQEIEQNQDLSEQERAQRKVELEMQTQAEITRIQQEEFAKRDAMIQRSVYQSDNAANQFAAGFASGSKKAANDLSNFGKQGQFVFTSLTAHASQAFMQLGEGSKKGSDIMRGALFGMMADIAQNYGQMLLGMSIIPPNPAGLAAGAGLLVLAGYLRSQSNKGGASAGPEISVGGNAAGGGDLASVASTPAQSSLMDQQQVQAKSVHLEVHGNIYDSDQTRQRITELVRQSIDATDFSITKVGGGL